MHSESYMSTCHVEQPRADKGLHLPLRKLTKESLNHLVAFTSFPMYFSSFPNRQTLGRGAYLLHDAWKQPDLEKGVNNYERLNKVLKHE